MPSPIHLIAHRAARRFIDLRLGWAMMRSPDVPVGKKLLALAIGAALTVLFFALEIPLEFLLGLLLPLIGEAVDLAVDGAEFILLPLLLALAVLPHLYRPTARPPLPEPTD